METSDSPAHTSNTFTTQYTNTNQHSPNFGKQMICLSTSYQRIHYFEMPYKLSVLLHVSDNKCHSQS